jgi:hypothetical protein
MVAAGWGVNSALGVGRAGWHGGCKASGKTGEPP